MKGNRDSELCALVKEKKTEIVSINGKDVKIAKFASSLRKALLAEHLGINKLDRRLIDPTSDELHKLIRETARNNTEIYRQIFMCYPDDCYTKFSMIPDKNSIMNKFGSEIRFRKIGRNDNPAPNNYYPESMSKGNGIIYNSRYNTSLGKTMGARLNELSKSATPGPGAYEFFSDFEGFYKYGKNTKKDNNSKENNTSEDKKETGDSHGGRSSDTGGNSSEQ